MALNKVDYLATDGAGAPLLPLTSMPDVQRQETTPVATTAVGNDCTGV